MRSKGFFGRISRGGGVRGLGLLEVGEEDDNVFLEKKEVICRC